MDYVIIIENGRQNETYNIRRQKVGNVMEKTFRTYALWMAVCVLTVLTTVTAWAETRSRVTGPIYIHIDSSISPGADSGRINVSVSGGQCSYDDVEILNEPDQWSGGDVPRIRISLTAYSGYYFSGVSKDMFVLSGSQNPKYSSTSVEGGSDKTTLRLTVKLEELDTDRDSLTVDNISWLGDSGIGEWSDSNQARSYQVKLTRDDKDIGSVYSTTSTSYDFSGLITRRGDYTFSVRVIDHGGNKGYWEESDIFYVDSRTADDFYDNNRGSYGSNDNYGGPGNISYGQWLQDSTGWWFKNSNGSYTQNNWQYINGCWYFFNSQGYMQTGWILWNNKWYYCDTRTGAMWHDTTTPDGYRVDSSGAWIQSLSTSAAGRGPGISGSGTGSTGGPGVSSSGQWIQDTAGWWFKNTDGSRMRNGWQYINGYWYFFNSQGYMETGWIAWSGKWYYCDTGTGAMWHDATTPDGHKVNSSGERY